MLKNQTCKVCNQRDKFNFNVADEIWRVVVPTTYQNHVVCLSCFDDFAYKAGINIEGAIDSPLYFAGDKVVYELKIISSVNLQV